MARCEGGELGWLREQGVWQHLNVNKKMLGIQAQPGERIRRSRVGDRWEKAKDKQAREEIDRNRRAEDRGWMVRGPVDR